LPELYDELFLDVESVVMLEEEEDDEEFDDPEECVG
jgi:hypothetical protein